MLIKAILMLCLAMIPTQAISASLDMANDREEQTLKVIKILKQLTLRLKHENEKEPLPVPTKPEDKTTETLR